MGFFDWLTGQFIDVIEWTDDSHDTMVYRFDRQDHEIKYGAKLTVRESQVAVFVNEGVIADILGPGIYELETNNLPIITTLQHWDHGFNSPFKAEVYFLNTKRFTDLKWGTKNPITIRDPEFKMVRLRAFGTYEIRISDPRKFMTEIVGTDGHFTVDEIDNQLTNLILSQFATVLGESKTPILDLASNYERFGAYITQKISPVFDEYGLELTKILVENISLPEEVEKALDRRTSREITGDLDANLKYQMGEALNHAGGTQGGSAMGEMISMGAGMALGKEMMESLNGDKKDKSHTAQPPKLPPQEAPQYHVAINGTVQGPYDFSTIEAWIQKGTITKETLLWREGLENWEKAQTILPKYFKTTPPPLPSS